MRHTRHTQRDKKAIKRLAKSDPSNQSYLSVWSRWFQSVVAQWDHRSIFGHGLLGLLPCEVCHRIPGPFKAHYMWCQKRHMVFNVTSHVVYMFEWLSCISHTCLHRVSSSASMLHDPIWLVRADPSWTDRRIIHQIFSLIHVAQWQLILGDFRVVKTFLKYYYK